MKNLSWLFLMGLFLVACGPQQASEEDTASQDGEMGEQSMEQSSGAEAQMVAMKGDNYEIKVADSEPVSPRKVMTGKIGDCTVTINYGSPKVKGRKVFGGLEPYGEVWRTGANEQTTIEFSQPVMIGDTEVPAGKYGLFTIPGKEEWTVIINEATDMWGNGQYDESKDVVRVTVPAQQAEHAEAMEFIVEGNEVVLRWSKVAVPFQVKNV